MYILNAANQCHFLKLSLRYLADVFVRGRHQQWRSMQDFYTLFSHSSRNGRAKKAEHLREGSPSHGSFVIPFRARKVKSEANKVTSQDSFGFYGWHTAGGAT